MIIASTETKNDILQHIRNCDNHDITLATYADGEEVSIECLTCGHIIITFVEDED